MKNSVLFVPVVASLTLFGVFNRLEAGNDNPAAVENTVPGFVHLDARSGYGQGAFPEPFLVDDSDLEVNEFRVDVLHTQGAGQHSDLVTAEVEKGFGLLTLEIEVPYERDVADGQVTRGASNVDLGARYPIYQSVSADGQIDSTFGLALEVGIPTNSAVSKNTEVVPKIFNDLKIGDHFTLQSILGYSALYGSGDDGGSRTFEYGFVFGYAFQHDQLSWRGVQQFIPIFEISGETALNKEDRGHGSVLGNLGFRVNLKAIGSVQPRLGLGYVFPLDQGAREDVHSGFITSFVFEY